MSPKQAKTQKKTHICLSFGDISERKRAMRNPLVFEGPPTRCQGPGDPWTSSITNNSGPLVLYCSMLFSL